jgi:predicted nucleic acid-binding protein
MTFSSCLTEETSALVLDASVIINLLATGHADLILQALPVAPIVTDSVVGEIEKGAINGRPELTKLTELIDRQVLTVTDLNEPALESFFSIVSGPASQSLGDGEASTLAYAYCGSLTAAIDERKATRVAQERFGSLRLATTVDIFAFDKVSRCLGPELLSTVVLNALRLARMQVWDYQFDWVVQQIGTSNMRTCPSLKRLARIR